MTQDILVKLVIYVGIFNVLFLMALSVYEYVSGMRSPVATKAKTWIVLADILMLASVLVAASGAYASCLTLSIVSISCGVVWLINKAKCD